MGILGSLTGDVSGLLERAVVALERIAAELAEANERETRDREYTR